MFGNESNPYRNLIAGVNTIVPLKGGNFTTYINFDNAATTPPFISVVNRIVDFSQWYSSIHRGTGYKSKLSSEIYDSSRKAILDFVGGTCGKDCVIYVKNTTEAINKLSNMYKEIYGTGVILSTSMEHHSNDLPWRYKFHVDYVNIDQEGRLDLEDLEKKLQAYRGMVRLVTVTGASNVTGYKNPIHQIARLAHKYGAKILVDGAQLVPHCAVDMKPHSSPEHIDYLAFSAHKMYAPFGIGVLIGPNSIFDQCSPDYKGGGTIDVVTHDYIKWAELPDKEEAGTPNVMGVVALLESINILNSISMEYLDRYERSLAQYTYDHLSKIPDIDLYNFHKNSNDRVSIVPFNIKGLHHSQVAEILSEEAGIGVRNGCFCAQPYIQKLLNVSNEEIDERKKGNLKIRPGFVRLSFGLYNTIEEIDALIGILKKIVDNKEHYMREYPLES
ncbi:aminotransferase class V-fold PLP-dependent enzyme [Lutispora thermophila]|uniref:Selenocysteine lyase/Cysteine desulfurase n=1 Tax=Lutispora thermophila DSM 19022 TaxID=1122184 RepID=A0A1M6DQA1_9FIRM|nr:aminotransferase class V-fold PLP-dependent enzyme [Lutispora thermophila]SHI75434.1 Selenocysteine lyase/Cysteine desulfurase [Lutispora thermophila DSM 19022]